MPWTIRGVRSRRSGHPEQSVSEYSDAKPLDTLILNVYGSGQGSFDLYEDDGVSLAYAAGQQAHTLITYARAATAPSPRNRTDPRYVQARCGTLIRTADSYS